MKKLTPILFLLLAVGACKKSNETVSANLTTTEAAELTATALASNSNGLTTVAADVTVSAQIVYDLNIGCGATKSYTVTHQSPAGAATSYNYNFSYTYTLNCNSNNIPDNITGTSSYTGSFDGPRLSSTNTGSSTFRVAGLVPASTVYVLNGEHKRKGSFTSKIDSKTTGTTEVTITVSNFTVNKITKAIVSGTGTAAITGTTAKGDAINITGTVNFTGDGNATVTINSTVYIVNLITGDVTKK